MQVFFCLNQLHTIIDFLIAYSSRCSSFFVKESLKATSSGSQTVTRKSYEVGKDETNVNSENPMGKEE